MLSLPSDLYIRTEFKPATDVPIVVEMHDRIYRQEYQFGPEFVLYVEKSLAEFVAQYDSTKDAVWMCEHNERVVATLFLMNRGSAAQLRYFLMEKDYRGLGLGKKLMTAYLDCLRERGYKSSYLWTTTGLPESAHLYMKYGFTITEQHPFAAFGKPLIEQRYDLIVS